MDLPEAALLAGVGLVAGTANTIAGAGSLLTFPTLLATGLSPLAANVTNCIGLVPGSASGAWGMRELLAGQRRLLVRLSLWVCLGSLVGAVLLLALPGEAFDLVVPVLVLLASVLLAVQPLLTRRLRDEDGGPRRDPVWVYPALFAAAVYGGYFGAGVGILMLAALGFAGFTNIHQMNGLKNWGGLCMNAVAAIAFAFTDIVSWPVALAMAVGATGGGYAGSRMAQRVPQLVVRRAIVVIGLTSGVWLMVA